MDNNKPAKLLKTDKTTRNALSFRRWLELMFCLHSLCNSAGLNSWAVLITQKAIFLLVGHQTVSFTLQIELLTEDLIGIQHLKAHWYFLICNLKGVSSFLNFHMKRPLIGNSWPGKCVSFTLVWSSFLCGQRHAFSADGPFNFSVRTQTHYYLSWCWIKLNAIESLRMLSVAQRGIICFRQRSCVYIFF